MRRRSGAWDLFELDPLVGFFRPSGLCGASLSVRQLSLAAMLHHRVATC